MKIISISDIHGDFETFDKALKVTKASDAEVLAISGDLIGGVFQDKEKESFVKAVNTLGGLVPRLYKKTKGQIRTIHNTASFLLSDKVEAPDKLKKLCSDYLGFESEAEKRMLGQYQEFRQRFDNLGKRVILVPGNWDGKCLDTVLAHENIHCEKPKQINGIGFVGYGCAVMHPTELPPDLTFHFNEDEAFSYLYQNGDDAEVALLHTPPKGFEGKGTFPGEYCLLAYLYRNAPSLILTGHTHNPLIAKEEKTGTIVINPGNLGRYEKQDFGTFLEISLDENNFVNKITPYKIKENSISRLGVITI